MNRYLNRAGIAALFCAIILHVLWGLALVISPVALKTTPMAYLIALVGQQAGGLLMFLAAFLSFLGLTRPGWIGLMLGSLQNALLWLAAASGISSIVVGRYPDGVVRSGWFIFADQLPMILFALLHAVSLSLYHGRRWTAPRY